jgi:hypothetical protein
MSGKMARSSGKIMLIAAILFGIKALKVAVVDASTWGTVLYSITCASLLISAALILTGAYDKESEGNEK